MLEAAFYSGQLHMERGAEDRALASFAVVAAAKPNSHPVYLVRARLYLARGDFKNGLKDLDAFLGLSSAKGSQSAAGLARRGRQLRQLFAQLPRERWGPVLKLALNDLEQAEKLKGWSVELYDDLGMVRESLGKVPAGIEAYTSALQLDPKNAALLAKRGWAHEKLAQYKEGLADFAAALAVDRQLAEAHAGVGYMQACLGKQDAAGRFATLALMHASGDYLVLHNVACIYAKLSGQDQKRARALQDMAVDLFLREVELWRRDRKGPNPIVLIRDELPALPEALRSRQELIELLKADR
jgi:tetratricopeptide (TPR) repeat protein